MKAKIWTAAAVVLAVSGAALAGEMSGSGGSANPASEKGVKTPQQPNETQPGQSAGVGDRKGDAGKSSKGEQGMGKGAAKGEMKGEMKGDAMGGGSGMKAGSGSSGMSSGSSNVGNPAESKGVKTPAQPNETQPGMGSNKSK